MRKKISTKRIIAFALTIAVLVTTAAVISGCKNGNSKDDVLTISILDRGKISASEGNYEENRWTKWIDEESGIDVDWVPIPRNESKQKILALLAAGQAPDLIVEYDQAILTTMVQQGMVMPIDEVIEKYSTEYKKYLADNDDLRDYVTYDGQMYAVTSRRSSDYMLQIGMWIRQDWLDKLGLEMPQTTDDLLKVAKAFRDQDPDGNGKNDTIPISMPNWNQIFPHMFKTKNWYDEGGTLKHGSTTDRYGACVEYIKNLYDEGLVDPEFITDKDYSKAKQNWVTGKSGIMLYTWTEDLNKDLLTNNPKARPEPMACLETEFGLSGFPKLIPNFYVAFNKDMKNPELAMKFIDWMISDGWSTLSYGVEGEHYKLVDGIPQTIDQEKFDTEVAYAYEYPIVSQLDIKPEWVPVMASQDEMSQTLAKLRQKSLEVNMAVDYHEDIPLKPYIEEVENTYNDFVTKRDEICMETIIGGPSKDREWCMKQIKSEWERLGGSQAEKLMNEWWKEWKKTSKR